MLEVTKVKIRVIKQKGLLGSAWVELNQQLSLQCNIIDGKSGPFASFTRQKGKDGKWYDTVWIQDVDTRKRILSAIVDEWYRVERLAGDRSAPGAADDERSSGSNQTPGFVAESENTQENQRSTQ